MSISISSSAFEAKGRLFSSVLGVCPAPVHVKLEGLNVAGSIKLTPALGMIAELERRKVIATGARIIESSSGNLGVALSGVCAHRGYHFTCVTDPNAASRAHQMMRALGSEVIVVTERDEHGGFLGTRIRLIERLCAEDPSLIWLNQYANPANWGSHYERTAQEIAEAFPKVDWLVIGAGTTGTLMGCGRYFRRHFPQTRIVAVDAQGSVTFGAKPAKRYIPGLGTSRRPEILDESYVDEVLHAPEAETILMCRAMARAGLLVGGSTGTVLAGISQLGSRIRPDHVVVTVSPDMGDKYLDNIYDDDWVRERFPALVD